MNARADNPHDQISYALLLALGIHAALILLLGFALEWSPPRPASEHLDVVLVNWQSEQAPDDPDYLAQANQQGGGETQDPVRPSQELSSALPSIDTGNAEINADPGAPQVMDSQRDIIARYEPAATDLPSQEETPEPEALPTARQLMEQSLRMARLQPELNRESVWRSKTPRRKFISANTRQYEFASYMQAWVAKVERIGNLNYPEEARRRNIYGDLVMTVGIRHNGSVESITIDRSSGSKVLDQAAVRIVEIAAPYTPLSADISAQTDVLHITRTWRFSSSNKISG